MKRLVKGALLVAGTALAISAAPAVPATAAASGSETFTGTIVFSALPGTDTRTVIGSVVRARGVFRGVGRVVELSQPLGQDDLVFPAAPCTWSARSGTSRSLSTRTAACSQGRSSSPGT